MISKALPEFWQRYQKLPIEIRHHAKLTFLKFVENPYHPGLHFKEPRRYRGTWSVRITVSYRAIGRRKGNVVHWFWIGNHSEFDRDFS